MFRPDRLINLRKNKRLTQEELGNRIKSTKGTISNYENGHSTPPSESLILIANVLDTTTDYLLGRTDTPFGYQPGGQTVRKETSEKYETLDKETQKKMEFFEKLETDLGLDLSDPEVQKRLKRAAKIIFSDED